EPVDDKDRRRREIEGGKLLGDPIQPSDGAAIVVLVMANNQLFGHALDPRWIACKRFHFVGHHSSFRSAEWMVEVASKSASLSGVIEIASKCVTLSALVHSAILPEPEKVLSSAVQSGFPSKDAQKQLPYSPSTYPGHLLLATYRL